MLSADFSRSAAFSAYKSVWSAADWVFPPSCAGCGKNGFCWCPECKSKISPMPSPVCKRCGLPVKYQSSCDRCINENPPYDFLRSYSEYTEPLRSAIIRMKEYPDYGLGLALSEYLQVLFSQLPWQVDLIVPVPINHQHSRQRGYNQTDLFAFPLALANNIPYSSKAVKRIRETRSQVGLSAAERATNVNGAFQADPALVYGKSILVVDDVATTGSSISACASALKVAGSLKVCGFTLSRPIFKDLIHIPADI